MMRDESDIIKQLRVEERSGAGSFYNTRYESAKPGPYISDEPDRGEQLRKAFAVILIIIMIVAILSFFASAFIEEENSWLKDAQSKLVGKWELSGYYSSSSKTFWTFYENKTLKITNMYYNYYDLDYYTPTITFEEDLSNNTLTVTNIEESEYLTSSVTFGSYKFENGKLYIKENLYYDSYQNYNYRFSENNSILYLLYPFSSSKKTLTKTADTTILPNVKWENINITISGPSILNWNWINLTRSPVSYYGDQTPSEWGNVTIGDVVEIGEYTSDIYVWIEWSPSDRILDGWVFGGSCFSETVERSKFINTWDVSDSEDYYSYSSYSQTIWTFYENKTLKITTYYNYYNQGYYNPIITFNEDTSNNTLIVTNIEESEYLTSSVTFGSYKFENDKLYISENNYYLVDYDNSYYYQIYDYRFSENNSKLYLSSSSSSSTKILTKTSEYTPSSTVEWKNINITISGSGAIHYDWIMLSSSSVSYYGSHAPSSWGNVTIGDAIQFGEYSFDIYVKFEWIPSDEVIDAWYFLVYSQPASTDPVVYLDFNEDTGNIAFDKSGNGNYGTVHGATRITGVSGQALRFDGINDWVEIKDNDKLELTEDFTIACWLYKSSSSYSSYSDYIFLSKHTPNLNYDYSWWLAISDRKLGFSSYPGSFVSGDQIIDSNTWLYVVITFDDSTNIFNIYIDGELDNQIEYNLDIRDNNKMVSIGAENGQNAFFGGFIDEFCIYNRVLSQDEIQNFYQINA